jgi:undecaprenyl-diphosphatase
MSLPQAVLLAVVQGFTEFLPISSSAHLALAPWLLGWQDQGLTFDIALHFGTLAAVCGYFFRDWVQIAAQALGLPYAPDPELRRRPALLWLLAGATIPVGITGFFLMDYVGTALRSPYVIGFMLVAVGLLMGWADKVGRRSKALGDITAADGAAIGFAQALAVIPGTSRSGITIVAGLFRGIDREAAARFSFLLSTPAIGGAALKAFLDLMEQGGVPPEMTIPFVTGMATSALTGCLVIRYFLRYLRHHDLRFFVVYRIIFGIIVLALAYFRHPAG